MTCAAVIDFETTGLSLHPHAKQHLQPRAIEFAGVRLKVDGTVTEEVSWLIHPGCEVSAEITKITGITNEQLVGQPPFAATLPALREFFAGVDVLVAHNLPFDAGILAHELQLAGVRDWRWPPILLDTVQTYEPLWGRRPRLIELYEDVIGAPYAQTHRALDDVRALAAIVIKERLLEAVTSTPLPHRIHLPAYLGADQQGGRPAG